MQVGISIRLGQAENGFLSLSFKAQVELRIGKVQLSKFDQTIIRMKNTSAIPRIQDGLATLGLEPEPPPLAGVALPLR